MKVIPKQCAIYCRKSSDEGLDTDFNTLDAQREACEAYITSQRAEGWAAIKTKYHDGGYSGGNLDRPALHRLLADIKEGKVQTIVVYKIDRLTRSLMDFAKLVDIFDEYGVTFVSVTQSFNTTTSMGRLTLNVLLSFAQFEREVSAERIRDKIAASKKKGMWMGGSPPVGYDSKDRKLIINDNDAKKARHIFDQYLKLGSVVKVKHELDKNGIKSKIRTSKRGNVMGGKPFSRGALHSILCNPIYIGKIKHKDKVYDGQHQPIIPEELWNKVQDKLKAQAAQSRGHKKSSDPNLLRGLLYGPEGHKYTSVFTTKKNKRYRYYINQHLLDLDDHPHTAIARIPAHDIENLIKETLQAKLVVCLQLNETDDYMMIDHINKHDLHNDDVVSHSVKKITVQFDSLSIEIDREKLKSFVEESLRISLSKDYDEKTLTLDIPFSLRRGHKGTIIIKPTGDQYDPLDLPPQQLKNLVRGIVWRDEHFAGATMKEIAARENLSEAGVRKIIMRSFDTLQSL